MKSTQKTNRNQESSDTHNHSSHIWLMILACGGAFLLLLILPILGVPKGWSVGIAIVVMLGLHLLMMKDHLGGSKEHNLHEK